MDELKDLRNFFNELDEEITNLTDQFAETKGVTKEIIQEHYEALLAGPMILFEQKRLLKKKELLIEIGRLYPDQNRKMYTPIFTFEDNSKWALGDAGFAYAPEIIESNYQIEENYLPLLPTLIETKAKNYEPWQYNLNLDNGYVLCVNKIDTLSGISFTYTIKKK
ncbi:hypothetical protein [Leptospira dzoumogneensis]|uniref:hypothetical protein n=1 Tax=Leptospira dzoumogneensis TaxID=2484904 RepID=UPI001FCC9155|nr:hypothetical protein [Leptospira dzoumogneensis]